MGVASIEIPEDINLDRLNLGMTAIDLDRQDTPGEVGSTWQARNLYYADMSTDPPLKVDNNSSSSSEPCHSKLYVRDQLVQLWARLQAQLSQTLHVVKGPPGVGKSITCYCFATYLGTVANQNVLWISVNRAGAITIVNMLAGRFYAWSGIHKPCQFKVANDLIRHNAYDLVVCDGYLAPNEEGALFLHRICKALTSHQAFNFSNADVNAYHSYSTECDGWTYQEISAAYERTTLTNPNIKTFETFELFHAVAGACIRFYTGSLSINDVGNFFLEKANSVLNPILVKLRERPCSLPSILSSHSSVQPKILMSLRDQYSILSAFSSRECYIELSSATGSKTCTNIV